MVDRSILVQHIPAPGAHSFALLSGIEAGVRGMLVSVMPLEMYRAFGDAGTVSGLYFAIGCLSLLAGLLVPWVTRHLPRRWTFTAGCALFLVGQAFGIAGGPLIAVAVACGAIATVTVFICLNAYVLDYIGKAQMGRTESLRMFYAATAWTAGPILGVLALEFWRPLPFLVAGLLTLALMVTFWALRLGNGRAISRAKGPTPNPLAYLARFAAQPRLVQGWIFAVVRSSGWWVFVVYLPIFAIEAGLDERLGGITLSLASAMMFTTPLMLRWMQRRSIRHAVRVGFAAAALCFAAATALAGWPWAAVAALMVASFFLVLLDTCGGLPFLLAVKPSERTEMAAVYSSFRDVSGIVTPGLAWAVLLVAPLSALFAAMGGLLAGCWALSATIPARLGTPRPSHGRPLPAE
jgi:MFS family permease